MNKIIRLQTYLELVQQNIKASTGPLKEFWQRESAKTSRKIESLR
jgi:hypothetical protein